MPPQAKRPAAASVEAPDAGWMRLALRLARQGLGLTAPNPAVGAVLVRNGRLLGRGWHRRAGGPHAEVAAIADARRRGHTPRRSTLYVTLEPCSTTGRTPPCTDAIADAGIGRVVFGATDPNPRHRGRATALLVRRGIAVTPGVLRAECEDINRAFNRWITTGRPWVVAKIAMSADGRIAARPGRRLQLTSAAALRRAHQLRFEADAILVGAETVRIDDPALTVRLASRARLKPQPWRVVLTRSGRLPPRARIFTDAFRDRTLVFRGRPLRRILEDLGRRGVLCALIEGGGRLLASAFREGCVDEIAFFIAPRIIGGPVPAVAPAAFPGRGFDVREMRVARLGPDILLQGYVHRTG